MNSIDILIKNLSSLPGIGKKSAARIAYYLLKTDKNYIRSFANSICDAVEKIKNCKICGNYTEDEVCEICSDVMRDKNIICVVEMPQDIAVIESTAIFGGQYHVLMGHISPIEGIGPDQINIKQLLQRVDKENISEIIIATNPSVEGDTTALYIQKLLTGKNIKITKLASGLPVGGDLEYTDKLTLMRSIQGRLPL
jgi:recombination protein RecR